MFGFSKKRFAALREQAERGNRVLALEDGAKLSVLRATADELSAAIEAVDSNDASEIYSNDENEQCYVEAVRVREALRDRVKRAQREQKRGNDLRASPALVKRFRLKRCPVCSGGAFFVREKLRLETAESRLDVALIVCAACGDARMSMSDDLALDRLHEDRDYVYVELPEGGPFRG